MKQIKASVHPEHSNIFTGYPFHGLLMTDFGKCYKMHLPDSFC